MVSSWMSKPILIVIPDEWRNEIKDILEAEKFQVLTAVTKHDAFKIIQSYQLSALIVISDWAIDTNTDKEIIGLTFGKIPTLTLIRAEAFQQYGQEVVFDKIYNPSASQEFCTIPFSADELLGRLRKILSHG